MNFDEFLIRMEKAKEKGYVKSHRKGDTGIGKTLEDMLGLTENNIAGPDFATYELKSARKDSSSMLTLFTKVPMPKGVNKTLLSVFGYRQRGKPEGAVAQARLSTYLGTAEPESSIKEKELHVTVDSIRPNSVGLKLDIRGNVLHIANDRGVDAYYDDKYLKEAFEKKYKHKLAYVLASSKKEEGLEWFWFNEGYLLGGFSFEKFSDGIREGIVKLDVRIGHYPEGRPHDHGTGFRVMPKDLPLCFAEIDRIL